MWAMELVCPLSSIGAKNRVSGCRVSGRRSRSRATARRAALTTHGTPYEPRNFGRHFTLRCSKASVRAIRVHDTRRTCASLLVALNVHPRVAMQILRHSQIAVTMDIYSEVPSAVTQRHSGAWARASTNQRPQPQIAGGPGASRPRGR
jgi:integrase